MRILITGASGFIGKNIIERLSVQRNKLLLLAKDVQDSKLLNKYNVLICDLGHIERVKTDIKRFNPQVCIHLAWEGIPDYSFNMSKKNLDNSLKFINFIANETRCKKLIISGSCWEYGKQKGICREIDTVNINSFFSWAKYSLYCYSDFICKNSNIDLIWFRIFYIYGTGQRKGSLIPSLVYSFRKGICPKINSPLNANDFIHVKDICEAFNIAVTRKIKPGIYNLGSGKSIKLIDICEIMEKQILGQTRFSNKIRKNINYKKESINFRADITKTQKALSWKPRISIKNGIKNYLEQKEIV